MVTVDWRKRPGVGGVWKGGHGVSVWLWSGILIRPQKKAPSRAQETALHAGGAQETTGRKEAQPQAVLQAPPATKRALTWTWPVPGGVASAHIGACYKGLKRWLSTMDMRCDNQHDGHCMAARSGPEGACTECRPEPSLAVRHAGREMPSGLQTRGFTLSGKRESSPREAR